MIQKSMIFDEVVIGTVGGNYYRMKIWFMTKSKVANTIKSANLNEKNGHLYL